MALEGRAAVIEEVVQNMDGAVQLAVTVEDNPGRDLGAERQIGHRFFFSTDEVEPLDESPPEAPAQRILVAGIGNLFLGDDGFGVVLAGRLTRSTLPAGVVVEDFGIRGMDLAYALQEYDVAILLDALPRGNAPGTLYLVEPDLDEHARLPRVLVLGCEPANALSEDDELSVELSEPVRLALGEAVRMVESLLDELTAGEDTEPEGRPRGRPKSSKRKERCP